MAYTYDTNNIFARILRGEIPNNTVVETEHTLAFRDIQPQAPLHVLVIPKGPYVDMVHFYTDATEAEIVDFSRTIASIASTLGLSAGEGGNGFRAISNAGPDSMQEVPHYHVHMLGGRRMGPLVASE